MKTMKTFTTFVTEKKVGDEAIGLDIKNEYTKLIDGPKGGTLDLGAIDDVSNIDIDNIKKTYKKATIKNIEGRYILSIND